ncbi:MAG: hypothetical protein GC172_04930 [Phycisphaera sp.]|nr:hypothetical protein [Phycisphaera sp.]
MTRDFAAGLALLAAAGACVLGGCAAGPAKVDRTEGLELSYRWTLKDEDRAAYYEVARDGSFGASGGAPASMREVRFRTQLDAEDLAEFLARVRATEFATRPSESGAGAARSELRVVERGRESKFVVLGEDESVEALRRWCAEIAMRQFRDVIDAQPEAGPRRR